jgi:hypothetical protein
VGSAGAGGEVGVARIVSHVFFRNESVNGINLDAGLKMFYRMIQWLDGGPILLYSVKRYG